MSAISYPIEARFTAKDLTSPAFNSVGAKMTAFNKKMKALTDPIQRMGAGLNQSLAGVRSLATTVAATLGTVGLAGAGAVAMVKRSGDAAEGVLNASTRLGIGTQEVQELKYVFDAAGASVETMEGALNRMTRTIYEARAGGKEAGDTLRAIGIKGADLKGKTSLDQMLAIYERINAIREGTGRKKGDTNKADALSMKVFGRSAQELKPVMGQKREDLDRQRQSAKAFAVPELELKQADDAADSLGRISATINALSLSLVGKLGPAIEGIVNRFADWAVLNKGLINDRLTEFVGKLSEALASIDVGALLGSVTKLVELLPTLISHLDWILGAMVAFKAIGVVAGIAQIGLGVKGLLAGTGILSGIGAMLAPVGTALAVIGGALISIPGAVVVGAIALSALIVKWDWVKEKFKQFFPETYAMFARWGESVKAWWGTFTAQLGVDWDQFCKATGDMVRALATVIENGFQAIGDFINNIFETVKTGAMERLNAIGQKIKSIASLKLPSLFGGGADNAGKPGSPAPASPASITGGLGVSSPEGNAGHDRLQMPRLSLATPRQTFNANVAAQPAPQVSVNVHNALPGTRVITQTSRGPARSNIGRARSRLRMAPAT